MSIENKAFKFEPDNSVSSQTPVETAEELKSFDSKMGGVVISRKTYKIFRFMGKILGRLIAPKPDTSGVTIKDMPNVGAGALLVQPTEPKGEGAVFIIHGGGYVVGNYKDTLGYACDTARELGVPVISPAYSLGPERPFPAGIDDLTEAWHWLQQESKSLDIDPTKIVVGGMSAGGGIAAGLVQKIHDEGGVQPSAQLLVYPMLDDRVVTKLERNDSHKHRVWNNVSNRFGWTSYLGHEPGDEAKPYSVPGRRENLEGLPTTWIGIGTADLFLDEDRDYAKKLEAAGVNVTYVEVAGAIHGFDGANTQMGMDFIQLQKEFMNEYVN